MFPVETSEICRSEDLMNPLLNESFLVCFRRKRSADIVIEKLFKLFAWMSICHHYPIALSNHQPFSWFYKFTEGEVCEFHTWSRACFRKCSFD
ncbi:hypothetical protein WT22_10970 [Burkholderia territorii]|nr:hypothetical protein WT22_10970 [Burkholderia territorii]KWA30109.1 hypothetical protein WT40_26160 [Burkholderia territorii]